MRCGPIAAATASSSNNSRSIRCAWSGRCVSPDRTYGLIKTKDGLVHRVLPGNYMGQADGKVTEISPSKISVVEIVPDGLGGYMERPASLALN